MIGLGASEILLLLLFNAAGGSDAVSVASPMDYFQHRDIKSDFKNLAKLASQEPKTGKDQIGQLLALRQLGEDSAKWKEDGDYAEQRKVVESIAAGKLAQDPQGFAKLYAQKALALADGKAPPAMAAPGKLRDEAFTWFPASADIVAALDTRFLSGGKQMIGYDAAIFKLLPKEMKEMLYKHLESMGNVQLDRVAFAFSAKPNREGEIYFRVTGKANREWLLEYMKSFGLEAKEVKGIDGEKIALFELGRNAPGIALIGDTDLLIVGYEDSQKKPGDLFDRVHSIRAKKEDSVAKGELKKLLAKVPDKASGLIVGNFPEDLKKGMRFLLNTAPDSILAYSTRAQNGIDFELNLTMPNAQDATDLVKKVSGHRDEALAALKQMPAIPDFPLAQVQNLLQSIQIQAMGTSAQMRVLVPDEILRALPKSLLGWNRGGKLEMPPQPPPKEKGDQKQSFLGPLDNGGASGFRTIREVSAVQCSQISARAERAA